MPESGKTGPRHILPNRHFFRKIVMIQGSRKVCQSVFSRASNIWASPHGRMKEAGQVKLAERSEGRSQGNIDKSTIPSLLFPLRFCI